MPFQSIPNTVAVDINMTLFSQEVQNTHYVQVPGGYSFDDVESIAEAHRDWVINSWKEGFSDDLLFRNVTARGLENAADLYTELAFPTGTTGEVPAESAPGGTSFSIKRMTGFTGRSRRGRIYVAGIAMDHIDGNYVAQVWADLWVSSLMLLRQAMLDDGKIASIVSRVGTGGLSNPGEAFAITAWGYADLAIDGRRDRLAGRGT